MKSFEIGKRLVYEAWEKVRANNGAPGVDAVSIGLFDERWRDNLYYADLRIMPRPRSTDYVRAAPGA